MAVGNQKSPAKLTIIRMAKKYMQRIPYGTEERPKIFNTAADVRTAGGTTDTTEGDMDIYDPILILTKAVQSTTGAPPVFDCTHVGTH